MIPPFSDFDLDNTLRRLSFVEINGLGTDEARRKYLANFIRKYLVKGADMTLPPTEVPDSRRSIEPLHGDDGIKGLVHSIETIRATQLEIGEKLENLHRFVSERLTPESARDFCARPPFAMGVSEIGSDEKRPAEEKPIGMENPFLAGSASSREWQVFGQKGDDTHSSGAQSGDPHENLSTKRTTAEDHPLVVALETRQNNWIRILEHRLAALDASAIDALCLLLGLEIAYRAEISEETTNLAASSSGKGLYEHFKSASLYEVKEGALRSDWNVVLGCPKGLALAGFGAPSIGLAGCVDQWVMIPPSSYKGYARRGLARSSGFEKAAKKYLDGWLTLLSEVLIMTSLTEEDIERLLGSRNDYIRVSGIVFEGAQAAAKGFLVEAAKRLDAFVFHMIASPKTSSELVKGGRAAVDGVLALLQDELGITSTTPAPGEVFTDTMVRGGAVEIIGQPDVSKGVGRTVTEVFGLALLSSEGTVYSTASVVVAAT